MAKRFDIRNSTAEFLIFMAEGKEDGVQVMYADETIWCTQDAIATLFDKGRSTIAEHLSNIFKEGELTREAVCRDFRQTATDGKSYNTHFYNLDAIISVGYRSHTIPPMVHLCASSVCYPRLCDRQEEDGEWSVHRR